MVMLADALAQHLAEDKSAHRQAAAKIAAKLAMVRQQARALSVGLVPADVDAGRLHLALERLAASAREQRGVACTLDCPEPVALEDTGTATHLFRIAQEAVHNALRHSQAQTITLSLRRRGNNLLLSVHDDGTGIPVPADETRPGYPPHEEPRRLSIESAENGGTLVKCTLAWRGRHG